MSVEKTTVWENEKWRITQYPDGMWMLKNKCELNWVKHPNLEVALNFEEIFALKEIMEDMQLT